MNQSPFGPGTQSAPPAATGENAANTIIVPTDALGLTTAEVAKALRVTPRTIREWVVTAGMPAVKIRRAVRFRPEAVRAWLAAREGGGA